MNHPAARLLGVSSVGLLGLGVASERAAAHVGALGGAGRPGSVPLWLTVLTGGAIVAASFLFTAFITNRRDIDDIADLFLEVRVPTSLTGAAKLVSSLGGVLALSVVLASGMLGPSDAVRNLGILLVWAGWWAGFTMSTYLVGNTWPAVNPFRTIAERLPHVDRSYPTSMGTWPATVGLLALVFLEVITPLATEPPLLATVVLAYGVATVAGAVVFGSETWFGLVDPVSRVFELYGRLAPVRAADSGRTTAERSEGLTRVSVGWPGVHLCRPTEALPPDRTAFVIALLWATTFDGLVSTPTWAGLARPVVRAGVPAVLLYLGGLVAGFGIFVGIYRLAAARARRTANTYVTARYLGGWFALALLPIAAGYHLAHFLGYFLRLAPALLELLVSPLDPPATVTLVVIPEWFGILELTFVVGGHLLAVWIAHSASFRLFPGALTPLRSQYPFVLAMVGYTVVSLWIVAQPYVPPPFV